MHQFSDSESTDSEDGIRFKTDSTRHKHKNKQTFEDSKYTTGRHFSNCRRSYSPYFRRGQRKDKERSRARSSSRSRSRTRSPKFMSKRTDTQERKFKQFTQSRETSQEFADYCKDENRERTQTFKEFKSISFGPELPPHLLKLNITDKSESKNFSSIKSNLDFKLDTLQHSEVFGPKLPQSLLSNSNLEINMNLTSAESMAKDFGTVRSDTPSFESDEYTGIRPFLPIQLREKLVEEIKEDDYTYGPLPIDSVVKSDAFIALEERALKLKIDQLKPKAAVKIDREEWMVELPLARGSNLGLGPRQFRPTPQPNLSDRSCWTDTPENKANKADGKLESKIDVRREQELNEAKKRDRQQEDVLKAHKKKTKKSRSLVQLHQDILKSKKVDVAKISVRQPFDREIDLKVRRFDEAQKKAVMKKAQLLDDRFCQGQSKFL